MRLALSQKDAAAALGVSVNFFKREVRPHVDAVYIGSVVRYPVAELQKYLDCVYSSKST